MAATQNGSPAQKKKKSDNAPYMEGIIFALGNPLLDISAEANEEFLKKYELKANDAILAEDKHKSMYDDMVENFKVEFVPGGATQNSIRVCQWMIGVPRATSFVGCIGKDKFGKILEERAREDGVGVSYQYHDTEPTGTCAVLLTGSNRSLCAYLAAANHFTKDHLDKPENQELLNKAQFYYISGFPLTVCPDAMQSIAEMASANNKTFMMNLSAPFLCSVFREPMMNVIPYVDILFGNESEAEEFSKEHKWGTTDLREIAMKLAALPKHNGAKARTVVLTHGEHPTIVVHNGNITEYPVIHIDSKDIVDTNGAGDAFVGGFLAQLVQGHSMDECIRSGNYAANFIIQRPGCTLPGKSTYQLINPGF